MNLLSNIAATKSNGLTFLKVILEQGDPFPASVGNVTKFLVIIGLLLLMGIILSNAYKNTNVYNMVVPKRPLVYKDLKDLLKDGFTIYTRSLGIDAFSWDS